MPPWYFLLGKICAYATYEIDQNTCPGVSVHVKDIVLLNLFTLYVLTVTYMVSTKD